MRPGALITMFDEIFIGSVVPHNHEEPENSVVWMGVGQKKPQLLRLRAMKAPILQHTRSFFAQLSTIVERGARFQPSSHLNIYTGISCLDGCLNTVT